MIANLCLSNKPVTYSRVLYDEQRRHSICRDGDSLLSCKDNRYRYVGNGSWVIVLFDYAIISSSPVS